MEEDRDKPWNFQTCKFYLSGSKAASMMPRHFDPNGRKLKTVTFFCESEIPEVLECGSCEFKSNLKVKLSEHFRVYHEGKEANEDFENILKCYKCKNCDFVTHSVLVLTKHDANCSDVFRNQDGFMCEENETSYDYNPSESSTSYGSRPGSYQTTYEGFINQYALYEHKDPKDINWFKHKEKSHSEKNIVAEQTQTGDVVWYECDQCAFKTKWKSGVKKHVSIHAKAKDKERFKCEQCAFESEVKRHLEKHIVAKHSNLNKNWFECDHCTYMSKSRYHLKIHVLGKHTNPEDINWLQCDKCDFKGKYKSILKNHVIAKHTEPESIKWFQCLQCLYKSKTRRSLRGHISKRHTNPRSPSYI